MALVDGKGIPVQALGCRKPSRIGYTKIASEKEFEHLIHTDLYESNGDSRPGECYKIVWLRILLGYS